MGRNLLHIPQGPFLKYTGSNSLPLQLSTGKIEPILIEFFHKLNELSLQNKVSFCKLDVDPFTAGVLGITNKSDLKIFLKRIQQNQIVSTDKILMYGATYFLDLGDIQSLAIQESNDNSNNITEPSITIQNLTNFMSSSNQFWLGRSKDIRNSTRRSLEQNWTISTAKTEANLDAFWSVFKDTQKRQQFVSHPKNYFQKLVQHKNGRIMILRDAENIPQSAWIAWVSENYLTYLHGGNTENSFAKHGQYLMHLAAIYRCKLEDKQFYDMGGYVDGSGFASFKDKYKGQVIRFPGPVDIVYQPGIYFGLNLGIKILKLFRP